MKIERLDFAEWEAGLPDTGFEVFHTAEALSVLDRHSASDLILFGGYRGDQLVAMYPLFIRDIGGIDVVSSPPPGMSVPRLGPIVMPTSPKRRKQEKVTREFTNGVLDELDIDSSWAVCRLICGSEYTDPRPYQWAGLAVEPSFTYRLSVGGRSKDTLLGSFSQSLRREIRSGEDLALDIEVTGVGGGETVFRETVSRYAEQDEHFGVTWPYVRDIITELDERCQVYIARDPDGEYLGGIITLFSNDAAYYWLGGTRASYEGVSVNSLLHWQIIRDVAKDPPVDSVSFYDLVGANTERLCQYKSKFGAELVPYCVVESDGLVMDAAKEAYQWANRVTSYTVEQTL
jgi:hypothetical protein